MTETEILEALRHHFPIHVQRSWLVAQPKSIQEAMTFLNDVETLDGSGSSSDHLSTPSNQGPRSDNRNQNSYQRRDDRQGMSLPSVQQLQYNQRSYYQQRWEPHRQYYRGSPQNYNSRGRSPDYRGNGNNRESNQVPPMSTQAQS
jgi:hypothetical protein